MRGLESEYTQKNFSYLFCPSTIYNISDSRNSQRGFRDVRSHDDEPAVFRRWLEDPHLFLTGEQRVEGDDMHRYCNKG